MRRTHLDELDGPFGIWQHAIGIIPDPSHGSCTDDVARALSVDLLHARTIGWQPVRPSAWRSLEYLRAAFDPATVSFRNLRSADGSWLEIVGSQDSQGRALLALGMAARDAPDARMRREAVSLLASALPGARRLTALRAIASAALACDAALSAGPDGEAPGILAGLAVRLRRSLDGLDLEDGWTWPEPILTYENALLPHALIVTGHRLDDPGLRLGGLRVLDWLIRAQVSSDGAFSPVGNEGWWPRDGARGRFDQQPIEATATILAACAAFDVTRDPRYVRVAEAAYGWFLGANDAGIAVAEVTTGGCHDGLSAHTVNLNQGAESTLMWLTALETMRSLRAHDPGRRRGPAAASRGAPPRRRPLVTGVLP